MAKALPPKAKQPTINPAVYFTARRMELAGMLNRGQALMLAATLPTAVQKPRKGKR